MSDKEAIEILEQMRAQIPDDCKYDSKWSALTVAIGAIKRDDRVDDITFHWNDDKNNFLAACNAFEDILRVYNRGVTND